MTDHRPPVDRDEERLRRAKRDERHVQEQAELDRAVDTDERLWLGLEREAMSTSITLQAGRVSMEWDGLSSTPSNAERTRPSSGIAISVSLEQRELLLHSYVGLVAVERLIVEALYGYHALVVVDYKNAELSKVKYQVVPKNLIRSTFSNRPTIALLCEVVPIP